MRSPDELAHDLARYEGVEKTMREFKHGQLHSGSKSGPVVTNRKQALAIGLNEEREKNDAQNIKKPLPHPDELARTLPKATALPYEDDDLAKTFTNRAAGALGDAAGTAAGAAFFA